MTTQILSNWNFTPAGIRPLTLPLATEIPIKNTGQGRGRFTAEVEALGKAYFGETFNLRRLRLLPYIWNRVNETDGVLELCRISYEEMTFIHEWRDKGFLKFIGRSISMPFTEPMKIRFDTRKVKLEVEKSFYDKIVNVLIVANYISEHNGREIGLDGKDLSESTVIPV